MAVSTHILRRPADFGPTGSKRVAADESPRHIMECREGRGSAPPWKNGLLLGALAPEATLPQGLKAQLVGFADAAGLKPRPSNGPRYHGVFRH